MQASRKVSHSHFHHDLLMEQNDEYAIQNRYMSLESLATISENRVITLLAAPALA